MATINTNIQKLSHDYQHAKPKGKQDKAPAAATNVDNAVSAITDKAYKRAKPKKEDRKMPKKDKSNVHDDFNTGGATCGYCHKHNHTEAKGFAKKDAEKKKFANVSATESANPTAAVNRVDTRFPPDQSHFWTQESPISSYHYDSGYPGQVNDCL